MCIRDSLNSMFIYFLTIIPLFPFYAGVTQVTSHMVRGEENVDVLDVYKRQFMFRGHF